MTLVDVMELLKTGGPYSMAILTIYLWWVERQERKELTATLLALSEASIAATVKNEAAIDQFQKAQEKISSVLDKILDRIK